MKTTDYIANRIDRLGKGYVFTYHDFITEVNRKEAVIKTLNRMATSGKIVKLSKGKYYKPELTPFGELPPDQREVVKDLLEKNGKLIGYITGLGIYNRLGLTTQISNVIQIGRNEPRPGLERGKYKIRFIIQKNRITKDSIPLLQILDAIRYIKKIPDESIDKSCKKLIEIVRNRKISEREAMAKLVIKYSPATRALLGAILEMLGEEYENIKKTLNPISTYAFGISGNVLTTKGNWNIL
ncbi:DUF6088 family protein [Crocinitomix catalasitica]|uniref:DUF6088 family protein n=1 Tax=Crocinitomix catalasitica TaxID=184607 RepID=UPI0006880FA6|nr:DUF6088 family protein [Crocinitomix catalasitica]